MGVYNQKLMTNVEAIQWTGTNKEEIKNFLPNCSVYDCYYNRIQVVTEMNIPLYFNLPFMGYVIKTLDGLAYGLSEPDFLRQFDPVQVVPNESEIGKSE